MLKSKEIHPTPDSCQEELGEARFITAGCTDLVPGSAVKYCAIWHISPSSQMDLFQIEAPAASSWWTEGDGSKAHISAWELSAMPKKRATKARMTHWTDDRNLSVGQQRDGWSHTGKGGRIVLAWPSGNLQQQNRMRHKLVWISERRKVQDQHSKKKGGQGVGW